MCINKLMAAVIFISKLGLNIYHSCDSDKYIPYNSNQKNLPKNCSLGGRNDRRAQSAPPQGKLMVQYPRGYRVKSQIFLMDSAHFIMKILRR